MLSFFFGTRDVKCCLEDAEEILRDQKEVLKTKEPSDGLLDRYIPVFMQVESFFNRNLLLLTVTIFLLVYFANVIINEQQT